MRIALMGRRFDLAGGGTERDLMVTAGLLDAAGHKVRVYAGELRGSSPDVDVRRVETFGLGRTLKFLSFAARAGSVARRDGADLVLSFARIVDADILRSGGSAHESYVGAARAWQTPTQAAAMRLSPYEHIQVVVERRGFRAPGLRKVVAVSELVRQDLVSTFALEPAKAVALYNGVDLERFRPERRVSDFVSTRHELGLPVDAPIVAFVGNGFARKGLRFLIEAWARVQSAAILTVAGTDRSIAQYRRLALRLGLGERIRFVGPQARVERLLAAVDALALPSLFEPFGNVVMEALAAGLPVLCSSACGAAETLPTAMRELVVRDPTDIEELAQRLGLLIEARGDLSKIARAAAERFTWKDHGVNLLRIINES